jgi:hypothetical protein
VIHVWCRSGRHQQAATCRFVTAEMLKPINKGFCRHTATTGNLSCRSWKVIQRQLIVVCSQGPHCILEIQLPLKCFFFVFIYSSFKTNKEGNFFQKSVKLARFNDHM